MDKHVLFTWLPDISIVLYAEAALNYSIPCAIWSGHSLQYTLAGPWKLAPEIDFTIVPLYTRIYIFFLYL